MRHNPERPEREIPDFIGQVSALVLGGVIVLSPLFNADGPERIAPPDAARIEVQDPNSDYDRFAHVWCGIRERKPYTLYFTDDLYGGRPVWQEPDASICTGANPAPPTEIPPHINDRIAYTIFADRT